VPELHVLTTARRWYAQRHAPAFSPEGLDEQGFVDTATWDEVVRRAGARGPLSVLLRVDAVRIEGLLGPAENGRQRITGPIPRGTIAAEPLRKRTSPDHSLAGALTPAQLGQRTGNHEVGRKLDDAFTRGAAWVRERLRAELRGLGDAVVDEVTQDTLAHAWASIADYRPDYKFRSWLWSIARYKAANERRRRCNKLRHDGVLDDVPSPGADALDALEDEERSVRLGAVARRVLDPRDQEIAELRYALDLDVAEIAARLGLPGEEVRVALQRIVRRLKRALGAADPPAR
jgi:RNA polymerase sigma-70 factor (ECF subfamily)